jgi:dipeptidyl aminopeptidase/acylaminoacyl peptidase
MGSSFGAYSAVFSAIKEPELYDCVIANAGAYDLELYYDDDKDGFFGTSFLDEMIGSDESQWNDYSPVNFVEQLKAPILIIHGTKDSVAPLEHAEKLKVELDKYNKRYDWFIKKREGHGFFANKNRIQSYKKIISFLSKELDL